MHLLTPKKVQEIIRIPSVAVLTLLLAIVCIITQLSMFFLLHWGKINIILAFVVSTASIFAVFTPMHDACHGSIATVSSGMRSLNDTVGVICGLCFPLPYFAFKHMHLQHHKHTNDHEKDPDAYAGTGPSYLLPLKWLTTELRYYVYYLPKLFTFQRPLMESVISLILLFGSYSALYILYHNGFQRPVLWTVLLPGRLALTMLAYFFDYLPHRSHDIPRTESEYKATSVISLYGSNTSLLTWPLLHQNYHNIHHLAPYVPFYYYSTIWNALKGVLMSEGTEIKPIIGTSTGLKRD